MCNGNNCNKEQNEACPRECKAPTPEFIKDALDHSRNFATAKPNIGGMEKMHILGLCNLLEQVVGCRDSAPDQPAQAEPVAQWQYKDDRHQGDYCWVNVTEDLAADLKRHGYEVRALYAEPQPQKLPDSMDRALDLYGEIECDLPALFGQASRDGHKIGQRLALALQQKMRAARSGLGRAEQGGEQ